MRDLGPVVGSSARDVAVTETKIAQRGTVRAEQIGDDLIRDIALPLQQFVQQLDGGFLVTTRLDKDVKNLAFVIDGPPEIMDFPLDADKDLV